MTDSETPCSWILHPMNCVPASAARWPASRMASGSSEVSIMNSCMETFSWGVIVFSFLTMCRSGNGEFARHAVRPKWTLVRRLPEGSTHQRRLVAQRHAVAVVPGVARGREEDTTLAFTARADRVEIPGIRVAGGALG